MSERKASVARRAAAEDQARRDAESARPASAQQAAQDVLNQQVCVFFNILIHCLLYYAYLYIVLFI
jgi:hypothetical protein